MAEKEYIEREAALKRNYFSEAKTPDENYRFNAEIKYFISSLPAADVEPVRHGRWIFGATNGHSWQKCSECCVSQIGQTLCFSYCPNCGAKMDGE